MWDLKVDILKIVLSCALDDKILHAHIEIIPIFPKIERPNIIA